MTNKLLDITGAHRDEELTEAVSQKQRGPLVWPRPKADFFGVVYIHFVLFCKGTIISKQSQADYNHYSHGTEMLGRDRAQTLKERCC